MNCLGFALRYWEKNPSYKLYYDGDHVINSCYDLHGADWRKGQYEPLINAGYSYYAKVFRDLLDDKEKRLLAKYFNENYR